MKNLRFKHILVGLAASSCLTFGSCTDLSENLYDSLNESNLDFTSENDVNALMGQAFAQFRYIYWAWNGYFDLQEECSDTYMTPKRIGIGWGDLYVNMHKHDWDYNLGHIDGFWNYAYKCIGYCNQCLDVLPEANAADRAQLRFLRATVYYMLMDAFRNVPLETTRNVPDGHLPAQSSAQDIFDFCVTELSEIKDDLGTEHVFGYANRYAACMTLAKLYLNHNAYFGGDDNSWYEKAYTEVNEVINDGGYSLAENYLDNFKHDIDSSPEVIFAIPLDITHASHNYLSSKCLPQSGLAAYGCTGAAQNGSCAVPQFIDTYDAEDKRLTDTWAGGIQKNAVKNSDGTYTPQAGDPITFSADDWSGTGYLNYNKDVHSIDNPGAYQQEGYRFVKSEICSGTDGTYGNDVAFYRLADAMFIKAECLLRLGGYNGETEQTAADLITEVRKRSFDSVAKATRTVAQLKGGSVYDYGHREYTCEGFANWDRASYVSTQEGGSDIILGGLLDDLGWEFVGEHHRRQDLIRFKMQDGRNVFNGKSWFCKDATTETKWNYFPLPKSALDANISLKQNEGYSGN
ncbi:RagB/SusD family nutrient uptake outer membrane protein [Bacteroides mediterraneensis]|uniref:RagB/SusD family nutrient uptake outer membrane protein n=1 Tax=Bacteroides mediterraneensis TaxID=1841856 RepID=UPI00195CE7C2|nr:RagB/SusD family nutrient uptake outer membrane protein [Bacteroides mediterraneensis]MBM6781926.1 RagB/SusD family nutrient uptake outer membrane protein [Bacteroides mediterraneensis]